MSSGDIQGVTSSVLLYGMTKYDVTSNTENKMKNNDMNFNVNMQNDYVDDGINTMNIKYIKKYMDILKDEYKSHGLKTNDNKTKLILNTNDDIHKNI